MYSKNKELYGYCPTCGGLGRSRERRPGGNDRCENGHTYPSVNAVADTLSPYRSPVNEADYLRADLDKARNDLSDLQARLTAAEAALAAAQAEHADALAAARAEGEAAGRAAERAAVVAYLRDHRDVADRRGGQQVDAGPNPAVRRWVLREAVPDILNGEHCREEK